jgi:exopolyphosphatase/guanosine-5'-triphosphate,3'-diphosphate pyrophosphatase
VTRVAAVDCGTNSLRLLIVDLDPVAGRAVEVERRTTIVRLGQDVDRTGSFAPPGRARIGAEPEVISGSEEARLSFAGATRDLVGDPAFPGPIAVLDIGGGSTELVTRTEAGSVVEESMDVGSVRLTERHLHDDPPTARQAAQAEQDVEAALGRLSLPLDDVGTLVGVAGTVTTLAAMVLGLDRYDRELVHRARIGTPELMSCVERVIAVSVAQRRALPFMHPRRADVIGGGALLLGCVVHRLGLPELVASEHDILDGIAWSLAPAPADSVVSGQEQAS